MRIHRRAMAVAAGATAVLAATIFAVTPAHADVNLLTNPGFESGSLSGWTCEAGASVVSGQARTGTYALAGTPGSTTAMLPDRRGAGQHPLRLLGVRAWSVRVHRHHRCRHHEHVDAERRAHAASSR